MPQPAQGPNSQEANMPRPAQGYSRMLSHLSLPGDLHPDPGSQVATVLSRISFKKTYP